MKSPLEMGSPTTGKPSASLKHLREVEETRVLMEKLMAGELTAQEIGQEECLNPFPELQKSYASYFASIAAKKPQKQRIRVDSKLLEGFQASLESSLKKANYVEEQLRPLMTPRKRISDTFPAPTEMEYFSTHNSKPGGAYSSNLDSILGIIEIDRPISHGTDSQPSSESSIPSPASSVCESEDEVESVPEVVEAEEDRPKRPSVLTVPLPEEEQLDEMGDQLITSVASVHKAGGALLDAMKDLPDDEVPEPEKLSPTSAKTSKSPKSPLVSYYGRHTYLSQLRLAIEEQIRQQDHKNYELRKSVARKAFSKMRGTVLSGIFKVKRNMVWHSGTVFTCDTSVKDGSRELFFEAGTVLTEALKLSAGTLVNGKVVLAEDMPNYDTLRKENNSSAGQYGSCDYAESFSGESFDMNRMSSFLSEGGYSNSESVGEERRSRRKRPQDLQTRDMKEFKEGIYGHHRLSASDLRDAALEIARAADETLTKIPSFKQSKRGSPPMPPSPLKDELFLLIKTTKEKVMNQYPEGIDEKKLADMLHEDPELCELLIEIISRRDFDLVTILATLKYQSGRVKRALLLCLQDRMKKGEPIKSEKLKEAVKKVIKQNRTSPEGSPLSPNDAEGSSTGSHTTYEPRNKDGRERYNLTFVTNPKQTGTGDSPPPGSPLLMLETPDDHTDAPVDEIGDPTKQPSSNHLGADLKRVQSSKILRKHYQNVKAETVEAPSAEEVLNTLLKPEVMAKLKAIIALQSGIKYNPFVRLARIASRIVVPVAKAKSHDPLVNIDALSLAMERDTNLKNNLQQVLISAADPIDLTEIMKLVEADGAAAKKLLNIGVADKQFSLQAYALLANLLSNEHLDELINLRKTNSKLDAAALVRIARKDKNIVVPVARLAATHKNLKLVGVAELLESQLPNILTAIRTCVEDNPDALTVFADMAEELILEMTKNPTIDLRLVLEECRANLSVEALRSVLEQLSMAGSSMSSEVYEQPDEKLASVSSFMSLGASSVNPASDTGTTSSKRSKGKKGRKGKPKEEAKLRESPKAPSDLSSSFGPTSGTSGGNLTSQPMKEGGLTEELVKELLECGLTEEQIQKLIDSGMDSQAAALLLDSGLPTSDIVSAFATLAAGNKAMVEELVSLVKDPKNKSSVMALMSNMATTSKAKKRESQGQSKSSRSSSPKSKVRKADQSKKGGKASGSKSPRNTETNGFLDSAQNGSWSPGEPSTPTEPPTKGRNRTASFQSRNSKLSKERGKNKKGSRRDSRSMNSRMPRDVSINFCTDPASIAFQDDPSMPNRKKKTESGNAKTERPEVPEVQIPKRDFTVDDYKKIVELAPTHPNLAANYATAAEKETGDSLAAPLIQLATDHPDLAQEIGDLAQEHPTVDLPAVANLGMTLDDKDYVKVRTMTIKHPWIAVRALVRIGKLCKRAVVPIAEAAVESPDVDLDALAYAMETSRRVVQNIEDMVDGDTIDLGVAVAGPLMTAIDVEVNEIVMEDVKELVVENEEVAEEIAEQLEMGPEEVKAQLKSGQISANELKVPVQNALKEVATGVKDPDDSPVIQNLLAIAKTSTKPAWTPLNAALPTMEGFEGLFGAGMGGQGSRGPAGSGTQLSLKDRFRRIRRGVSLADAMRMLAYMGENDPNYGCVGLPGRSGTPYEGPLGIGIGLSKVNIGEHLKGSGVLRTGYLRGSKRQHQQQHGKALAAALVGGVQATSISTGTSLPRLQTATPWTAKPATPEPAEDPPVEDAAPSAMSLPSVDPVAGVNISKLMKAAAERRAIGPAAGTGPRNHWAPPKNRQGPKTLPANVPAIAMASGATMYTASDQAYLDSIHAALPPLGSTTTGAVGVPMPGMGGQPSRPDSMAGTMMTGHPAVINSGPHPTATSPVLSPKPAQARKYRPIPQYENAGAALLYSTPITNVDVVSTPLIATPTVTTQIRSMNTSDLVHTMSHMSQTYPQGFR